MKKKEFIIPTLFFTVITCFFFYKTIFLGLIPFPGDLLIAEYSPWKTYSYFGYTPGSFPNKAQYFDVLRQLYPWKELTIDLLKTAQIPLWNPYNFSGSPLLANMQSSVFYPFNVLYVFFPIIVAWTVFIVLQPLLAGIFTYLYLREIGVGKVGRLLSSVCFSYSLFMSVFLEYNTIGHVLLWLPLLLYAFERLLKKKTKKIIFVFIGGIVFSFFAGHLQIFGFVLLFLVFYIFFRIANKKRMLFYMGLILLGLGVCAIQLFPTLELILHSARTTQAYQHLLENLLLQPYQLIVALVPDIFGNPANRNYTLLDSYPGNAFYIGIMPLFFASFSLIQFRKSWFVTFFAISLLVLFTLLTKSPLTEVFYLLEIPFFSTGSPTNALFLVSFCLSVLAGIGVDGWQRRDNSRFFIAIIVFTSLLFLAIGLLGKDAIRVNNFFYSAAFLFFFIVLFLVTIIFSKTKQYVVLIFLLLSVFDLFYFFQKFNPFVSRELVFPQAEVISFLQERGGIDRFWGYGSGAIEANFATHFRLFSPDGYDPLYPKVYGEFIQASKDGKIPKQFDNTTRSDAVVAPGYGKEDLTANMSRLRVLNALGVRYILDREDNASTEVTFPPSRFTKIYENNGWQIFENKLSAARFFLASHYAVAKTKKDFEKIFFSDTFDIKNTVVLEKNIGDVSKGEKNEESVVLRTYSPNEIEFFVKTNSKRLLFLSDTYFPGWKASVDNSNEPILRANYAFRAVIVPPGTHSVSFQYKPLSFTIGSLVTIISIGGLLLYFKKSL